MNGETRVLRVLDTSHAGASGMRAGGTKARRRADKTDQGQIGAPMPGVVVDVRVAPGKAVKPGDVIAVLSAMKMETVITASRAGTVKAVTVSVGETLEGGDLVAVIE